MIILPDTRIQLVSDQSSSVLGNETILLNFEQGEYYELNQVGGFIWALLKENPVLSIQEIQDKVAAQFDVTPAMCQEHLRLFLEDLLNEKLIKTVV